LVSVPSVVPFEAVPVAMLLADSRAQVVAANARWAEWSGLGVEDSLGSRWTTALGDEERRLLTAELAQLVVELAGGEVRLAARAVMGPGRRWWLAPFESSGQMLIGIVVAESGTGDPTCAASQRPLPALQPQPVAGTSPGETGDSAGDAYIVKGIEALIEVMTTLASSLGNS
jgi:PAS domain-containing protein